MRFEAFTIISALGILFAPPVSDAQSPTRVPHLGYMSPGDIPRYDNAFLQGLQQQGYILPGEIPHYDDALWQGLVKRGFFEGRKIRIEIRTTAERYPERAPELAAELVRLNVDLIFASTPAEAKAAAQAARQANKALPIVFGPQPDPVGAGLVPSLARPGGNITGLVYNDPELVGKRLEILKETLPRLSRLVYLHEPAAFLPANSSRAKEAARAAARANRVRLEIVEVLTPEDVGEALEAIARGRPDGIMVMDGPILLTARHRIIDLAAKRRLPAMYGAALFVEAGGLMFYGPPYADLYGRAAGVVAKVLNGTKPADIPVAQPTIYKLLINGKTAKTLGIAIPQSVLLGAEIVDTLEP
jgi:ABC-type uncharacterized transport system substrate-binding protein